MPSEASRRWKNPDMDKQKWLTFTLRHFLKNKENSWRTILLIEVPFFTAKMYSLNKMNEIEDGCTIFNHKTAIVCLVLKTHTTF